MCELACRTPHARQVERILKTTLAQNYYGRQSVRNFRSKCSMPRKAMKQNSQFILSRFEYS